MELLGDFWQTKAGKIALVGVSLAAATIGVLFLHNSSERIWRMRQFELVPHVSVADIEESGPVKLTGRVALANERLESPRTNTPSVFYRYLVLEVRDRSGQRRSTADLPMPEQLDRRSVDFYLVDDTGRIRVEPQRGANFAMQPDFSEEEERYLHEETRLEPGDDVFVSGYAARGEDGYRVVFDRPGAYLPTISDRDDFAHRSNAALFSALGLLIGLALISVSLVTVLGVLRVHHSAGYLSAACLLLAGIMLAYGLRLHRAETRHRASQPAASAAEIRPIRLDSTTGILGLALGLVATFFATRRGIGRVSTKRIVEDLPTSAVGGAAYGMVELTGVAAHDDESRPLRMGPGGVQCIYYHEITERRAGDGWALDADREGSKPFYCVDETGRILIDPDGAEFIVEWSVYKRRRRLKAIRAREQIYVLGKAEIDPETHDRLIVGAGEDDVPFIISSLPEKQVKYRLARPGFWWLNFGLLMAIAAALVGWGTFATFGFNLYVSAAASAVIYLLLVLAGLYYNGMIFLRRRVERNWANIDVALQKRFDLVAKLQEIVGEYLDHEHQVHTLIAEARAQRSSGGALDASDGEEAHELEAEALEHIIAVIEAYPKLTGDKLVGRLMDQLTDLEDEIALMTTGYNDSVERYNTRIRSFPEVFLAIPTGFWKADYFHPTTDEAR